MKCPSCGAANSENASFCGVCGAKFENMSKGGDESVVYDITPPSPDPSSGPSPAPVPSAEGLVAGSLSEGWATFKANPGPLVGGFIILFIIAAIGNSIISGLFNGAAEQFANNIWGLVINVFTAGYLFTALKLIRKQDAPFGDLFSGFSHFIPILLAGFVQLIAVILGLMLLVVPGIIIALGLSQWMLLIMDRESSAMDSLKQSWAMMQGYKIPLFLMGLAMFGINLLGALALLVGLLVTVPMSIAAMAAFYNKLLALNPPQDT